jgi:hypothetical protein
MVTEKTCLPRDHVFKGFLSSILVSRESNNALIKIFLVFIQIKKKKIIAGRGEQSMDSLLAGTQRCKCSRLHLHGNVITECHGKSRRAGVRNADKVPSATAMTIRRLNLLIGPVAD